MQPRGRHLLEAELPDVRRRAQGGRRRRSPVGAHAAATIADRSPRPGDERLTTVTARRPTLERRSRAPPSARTG